jgi:hypothetical protein
VPTERHQASESPPARWRAPNDPASTYERKYLDLVKHAVTGFIYGTLEANFVAANRKDGVDIPQVCGRAPSPCGFGTTAAPPRRNHR